MNDFAGGSPRTTADSREVLADFEASAPLLESIPFASIHSISPRAEDLPNARSGLYRIRDTYVPLEPPVDWSGEPYTGSLARAFVQNSFGFADPLLADADHADLLESLARIFVDWVNAHPRSNTASPHHYAWHDHAAAGRLVYMAYLLREAVRLGRVDHATRLVLMEAVLEHADFVISEYVDTHNHGLFSDAALALAARSIAPISPSETWRTIAQERFAAVLDWTVAGDEGIHLEHSPAYQLTVRAALERFADAGVFPDLGLPQLIERMREAEAWLVDPAGEMPPIGDTVGGLRAPAAAARRAKELVGLRAFPRGGYVVVRSGDSMLVVCAAFHPTAHKHADDTSFCLYEGTSAVITDSGDPGYDYAGPDRRFGTSPAAHSNVAIDEFDWVKGGARAYGSGVLAADVLRDDVYAILVENPVAAEGGSGTRRLFVYSPGEWLVIVDAVAAGEHSQVVRRLQLARGLDALIEEDGLARIERDGVRVAQVALAGGPSAERLRRVRGQDEPVLAGYEYPSITERVPRTTVLAESTGSCVRGFALALGPTGEAPVVRPHANAEAVWADITVSGGQTLTVHASREGIGHSPERIDHDAPIQPPPIQLPGQCPICGTAADRLLEYNGRSRARCPTCQSLERHRVLHQLWGEELSKRFGPDPRILLCTPNRAERDHTFAGPQTFTCDIGPDLEVDLYVDLCDATTLPDASFDVVVANHLFAHMYDLDRGLGELARVLRPGGMLLATTPVHAGGTREYADEETITRLWGRELYERYRIGTFRLLGEGDLLDRLGRHFDTYTIAGTDPCTDTKETVYVGIRVADGRPMAREPADRISHENDLTGAALAGYPFHLSRATGRPFVFCLDAAAEAHELPVTDIGGTVRGHATVLPFDGPGDVGPSEAPSGAARLPLRGRFRPPAGLASGVYLLGGEIPFVVRRRGPARIAVLLPTHTGVGFNPAGGRSFYDEWGASRSDVLSLHRPIATKTLLQECEGFVHWFADSGPANADDVTFLIDSDLDDAEALDGVELLVVVGRAEYWTRAARENFDAFVAGGGRALLLCSEIMHWQVRFDPLRQELTRYYRDDPEPDPLRRTLMWHEPALEYPVYPRVGGEYWFGGRAAAAEGIGFGGMRIVAADSPLISECGMEAGEVVPLSATVWDGVPVCEFRDGVPQIDWREDSPYRHEVIAFNRVTPAVPRESGGAPATSVWLALQRTPESGTVVHAGTFGWCQNLGGSGASQERTGALVSNMMRTLLAGRDAFTTRAVINVPE